MEPAAALFSEEDMSRHSSAEEDQIEADVNKGEIIPLTSEAAPAIMEKQMNQHGDTSSNSSSYCIFRTPFPELGFQEPQLVCIGPYHRGKNLPLENFKYFFLDKFMSRTRNQGKDLCFYVKNMMTLEWDARGCYSEDLSMSTGEFTEMMLVDACFILEVLHHFGRSAESENGVFPIQPWQIPILVRDLLMLENQIPFFVLENLFDSSESEDGTKTLSVTTMALKFFDLAFPVSMDFSCKSNHLLDLFLESIRPSSRSPVQSEPSISKRVEFEQQCDPPPPPVHLIRSVMELRTSDIELRPRNANRFTDINFRGGVLEIPPVSINDHFIAILINCMAFEHCSKRSSKDLTAYVSFMSGLIRHPTDAELLYSNGIVSGFSNDAERLADSFHSFWESISNLDLQDCYLSETLKETERYYTRIGKTWWWWRFFQRYYGISLFCITNFFFAFYLLRSVANSMIQEVKLLGSSICMPPSQGHGSSSFICDAVFLIVELTSTIARPLVTSPVLIFCFLVAVLVFMGSKAWLRYSLNISEQSVDNSTGLSCSSETAMKAKKGSKFHRKGKEAKPVENKSHDNLEDELNPDEIQKKNGNKKGGEGEKKENGSLTLVFKVGCLCDGCAYQIRKCIRQLQGVETVKITSSSNEVTVIGAVDPTAIKEKIVKKTKNKVELISSQPKEDDDKEEKKPDKHKNHDSDSNKQPEKKPKEKKNENKKGGDGEKKEKGSLTLVFKVVCLCEGCAIKIRKCIGQFQGVETVKIASSSNEVTVIGTVDPTAIKEELVKKTKNKVELISPQPKKDDNKEEKKGKKPDKHKNHDSDSNKQTEKKPKEGVEYMDLVGNELKDGVKSVKVLDTKILERLKFSYDRLEDPKIQNFFLYSSFYLKHFGITKAELIENWIDEGLLDDVKTREAMFDRGHSILNQLVDNCLLERVMDMEEERVKMHDVALYIKNNGDHQFMVKAGMRLKELPGEDEWTENLEKVSLMDNSIGKIPPHISPRCPHLSTLILRGNYRLRSIPDSFFEHMPGLKVLDLSWTQITALPDSISKLKNLLALILAACFKLSYLPSLAELKALRKLDLYDTIIEEVPRGIDMLENLRFLRLTTKNLEELPVGILSKFSHLQYLKILGLYLTGEEVGKLRKLEIVSCAFRNWQEFGIYAKSIQGKWPTNFCFQLGSSWESRSAYRNLPATNFEEVERRVNFVDCEVEKTDDIVIPNGLFTLGVEGCDDFKCLSHIPFLHKATGLKRCEIGECGGIECVIDLSSYSFNPLQNIEELKLEGLDKLHEIVREGGVVIESTSHAPTPLAIFSSLKVLTLYNCSTMKTLLSLGLVRGLQNLENMEVCYCKKMEKIIASEEEENHEGELGTTFINLPKLKSFYMSFLPNLKSICGRGVLIRADSLQFLEIKGCEELKRIPLALPLLENGQPSPPPSLEEIRVRPRWWESVKWDDPQAKQVLSPFISYEPYYISDGEEYYGSDGKDGEEYNRSDGEDGEEYNRSDEEDGEDGEE